MTEHGTDPHGDRGPRWGGFPWRRWHGPPWAESPEVGRSPRTDLPWRSTLLVTVFVVIGSHFAARGQLDRQHLDGLAMGFLVGSGLLLLWRQRWPVLVALGTAAATLAYLAAGYPYGPVFVIVALACFSAIVAGRRWAAWTAVALLWSGHLVAVHWLYPYLPPAGDGPAAWQSEAGVAAWALAVVAVSELARVRRDQWAKERAERAQAARRRADEERLRIARELHDVLAHSISVINVQAGVGLALLDSDPEQARTALTTIKAASKEALGEVRQVLDTLRAPGEAPRTPAPGLARLAELVEQAAGAGLTVHVDSGPGEGDEPADEQAADELAGKPAKGPAGAGPPGAGVPPGEAPAPAVVAAPGGTSAPPTRAPAARTAPTRATGRRSTAAAWPTLPPGLDLAAFRIVQEALTNIVRHSGSRQARVHIRYGTRSLRLRVDDDGPATGTDAGGSGHGLAGMRERAAALGGTLEAGPRADGGFRVSAVLPLREDR